ncbi:GIY-YIG nuclease family protein [Bradyrhizobium denitrificans]|uniref:GIY-YIG nuclease family protein n=1 Tax=Bradyrhizobium denitrificans TaxID=2734912 RepID=UPI001553D73F|nr:GIY-YIG nuclease family protein [Bradyrhizobium sp. LMG 8443]NPU23936.1 GIY-YIG nuclease family protein [Bradyrhizobium sp. LMG 8443]
MAAYVYVISGEHGRQKIGVSDEPRRRLAELQTGSPFALKFEFVGEVENGGAGPVEVETHFMLNQHKAPGGDEWFVVPPDVAITAVMATAHRLGYRIKPVDPDASGRAPISIGPQPWHHWMTAIAAVPLIVLMAWLLVSFNNDQIGGIATAILAVILVLGFKLLRFALIEAGKVMVWAGRGLNPGPDG